MTLDVVIFYIAAVLAVSGAVLMVFQRNPVLSILYLILSLVAQAVLYVQLNALFLGALLIIIYSGAILVLFLFVIMLLNLRGTEDFGRHSHPVSLAAKAILSIVFVIELIMVVMTGFTRSDMLVGAMTNKGDTFGSVESVATLLYTKYLYPFELASILLLAAIVGAVVLAKHDRSEDTATEGTSENEVGR